MAKTKISLIAAVASDRGIGKNNKLLFDIPDDLKYFREKTRDHTVVMGYNTYKSIGRALPDRRNIVLSRQLLKLVDAETVKSIEEAIKKVEGDAEVFVIGGASIYEQFLPLADKLYLTLVETVDKEADTFFPDYSDFQNFKRTGGGESNGLKYTFCELTR
jgi:dihydrofolate reductase